MASQILSASAEKTRLSSFSIKSVKIAKPSVFIVFLQGISLFCVWKKYLDKNVFRHKPMALFIKQI